MQAAGASEKRKDKLDAADGPGAPVKQTSAPWTPEQHYCEKNPMLCFASCRKRGNWKEDLHLHMTQKHRGMGAAVKIVQMDRETREARCCLLPWDYFMMVEADNDQLFLVFRDFVRFLGDVFYCFSLAKYDCRYTLKVKDTEKEKWYAMGTVEVQMVQPEGDGMSVYDRLLVPHLYRSDKESKRKRLLNGPADQSTNPATAFDLVLTLDPAAAAAP